MKNPLAHVTLEAPLQLLRSLLFHISGRVSRVSVSTRYLGLCAYINLLAKLTFEKDARVVFEEEGFLAFGTERSSFRGWAGRTAMYIRERGRLIIRGYNEIGRGSLVWILESGTISFGGNTFTAGNNMLISKERISIGRNCAIAWGVTIADHDFHKLYANGKQLVETAPIIIEDGVWIGMNATILKGVRIGAGAVVGAHAVVTRDVPPATVVAGNPARVVRENVEFRG